jgi:acetoin utilization deacetylase AcuC-like enzyme
MLFLVTHPDCTRYHTPGHPEAPFRVRDSVAHLKKTELALAWEEAVAAPEAVLARAHDADHIARIRAAAHDFDADTAAHPDIATHAARSVGAALQCLQHVLNEPAHTAFSLMRPPGHHATRNRAMGFCYFNQAAIAALEARAAGVAKVGIYDFDVHHGNGTEEILHNQPGITFHSIHQYPCYPGTGSHSHDNCHNYPVAPASPRAHYRDILAKAFDDLRLEKPDLIVVSAGFDAYSQDPLAEGTLEREDYEWLGRSLRETGIPFLSILEGGYSRNLPELIEAYLRGSEKS